ncbi:MAG: class A beta-lactamase-related serine hydrolase [Rivularia sp. ALOHA_DT_140]|nr:class A beta-lactamase-related serine hydrolase [Rivularia sp. ALOHA_DT_140]
MRISDKKRSVKLFKLRFLSLVVGVALTIISIGLFLLKQQNSHNQKQIATKENQSNSLPFLSSIKSASPINLSENIGISELAYNIQTSPKFIQNQELQNIVNDVVDFAKEEQFPTKKLSITLIDLEKGEYGEYQQEKLRYPASVVKLFWMVNLYAQIEKGILSEPEFPKYLNSMIQNSDNEAASYIVDRISKTKYRTNIQGEEFRNWRNKRLQVNQYFKKAKYKGINVSQKTFPIPSLKLSRPKGADLKLRESFQKPIRNKISTQQVARLLYEIHTNQSVSEKYSQKMSKLLTIDAQTRNIKREDKNPNEFNPVRGFLSASLANNIGFRGKAGWTSNSRNDGGIITTPDGKSYILVVFGEDRAYAYDWKIFPQISRLVFNRMTNKK